MDLHIDSRDIRVTVQDIISVQDDTNTQVIEFVFAKELLEYALWELNAFVIYAVSGSSGVRFDICTKTVTDSELKVQWVIRKPVTYAEGKLQFQVVFTDTPDPITKVSEHRWSTKIATVTIPKTLAREKYAIDTEPVIEQMMAIAAVCAEAGEKVSRAEAAAVRAEQAADSIQEAVDANTAAQAAKAETISAKNATIAASQTAQLEAQKVQQIVAGNEAYTKTESDLKYTVAPRKEASSTNGELKLNDADEGLSYLELQGNSGQYTNTANKNLIDLNFATDGYSISSTGTLDKNEQYFTTGYIVVEPGEQYTFTRAISISNRQGCFYDKDKIFLQPWTGDAGLSKNTVTVPENAKYLRLFDYISHKQASQLEKGNTATDYVPGAVDTPSPEYPSEVRSVGDIPKDVNGVEIRNLLPNESIENLFVYEDTKDFIYLKLAQNVKSGVYCAFSASATTGNGLYCRIANTIPSWGPAGSYQIVANDTYSGTVGTRYSYGFTTSADLYITFTQATLSGNRKPDKALIKQFFEKHTIMVTSAAEIDEYRPYIGENNGLVKLESIGVNHADTGDGPVYIAGVNRIEVNTWTPRKIVLTQKNKDTSYAYLKLNVERGKDYTFYCKVKVEVIDGAATDGVTSIGFRQYPPGGVMYGQTMLSQDGQYKDIYNTVGVIPDDVPNIAFMLYLNSSSASNGNIKMTIDDLMVVEGTKTLQEMKALKFQPYYQQITWIPLKEPLRKIANSGRYLDSLDKDGNVTQMIVKKILNKRGVGYNGEALSGKGVQGVISLGTSNVKFDEETQYSNQALSNVFKTSYGNIMNYQVLYRSSVGANVSVAFIVDKNILSSNNKEGLLNYLMTLPDIAEYFVLDTPVNYQIPAVYIETHDPETNVRCLNKVKPSDMTLDYKIAMSSLIKRLEALESKTVQEV